MHAFSTPRGSGPQKEVSGEPKPLTLPGALTSARRLRGETAGCTLVGARGAVLPPRPRVPTRGHRLPPALGDPGRCGTGPSLRGRELGREAERGSSVGSGDPAAGAVPKRGDAGVETAARRDVPREVPTCGGGPKPGPGRDATQAGPGSPRLRAWRGGHCRAGLPHLPGPRDPLDPRRPDTWLRLRVSAGGWRAEALIKGSPPKSLLRGRPPSTPPRLPRPRCPHPFPDLSKSCV